MPRHGKHRDTNRPKPLDEADATMKEQTRSIMADVQASMPGILAGAGDQPPLDIAVGIPTHKSILEGANRLVEWTAHHMLASQGGVALANSHHQALKLAADMLGILKPRPDNQEIISIEVTNYKRKFLTIANEVLHKDDLDAIVAKLAKEGL